MAERRHGDSAAWRALRLLLPSGYRRTHAADLLQVHIDVAGGAMHARGPRFWARVASDVVLTAVQLRIDALRGRRDTARRRARVSTLSRTRRIFAQSVRDVARSPGFAIAAAVTLGLGIGANATMYTVLDRLLLSPPEHVRDAESVRQVYVHGKSRFSGKVSYQGYLAYPDYRDLQRVKGFSAVAAYTRRAMTMGRSTTSEEVNVELASASYFPLLGVEPAVGRFYNEEEDRITTSTAGVVLSYDFWQRRFGGARDVIGRVLDIGRGHYPVVGIAPRGFTGAEIAPIDAWLPLHAANAVEQGVLWVDARTWSWFGAIVRMAPGVTDERVMAEATASWRAGHADVERADKTSTVVVGPLIVARGPEPTREAKVTKALGAVAILVLLIACANAGNLFLARGVQRRRTYAVQSALGVSRGEMIAQLFCESILIASAAGVFAFGLARVVGPALFRTLLPNAAPPTASGLRIALVTFAFALFTAVLAGLLTAIRSSRVAPIEVLRAGRSGLRTSMLRRSLVALQASLAVILLIGAGLFLRSLSRAQSMDLGVDLNAVSLEIELSDGTSFGDDMPQVTYPALARVRSHPAVGSATVVSIPPFFGVWGITLDRPGPDSIAFGPMGPFYVAASGDYFRTLGMRIVRGRPLTDADDNGAARVAVVNESMARAIWPDKEAIGECLLIMEKPGVPPCTTVVGITSDVLPDVEATEPFQYVFLPPHHPDADNVAANSLLVRLKPGANVTGSDLAALARSAAPEIRFVKATTLRSMVAPQLRSWQLGASLLTAFGVLALVVAAAGLYSVLAFEVAQRRFELGVRSALGASSTRIIRSLLADVLRTTVLGILAGLLAAIALSRVASALLFQVEPTDPVVYAGAVACMALIGAVAAVLPAMRAVRVSPRTALSAE